MPGAVEGLSKIILYKECSATIPTHSEETEAQRRQVTRKAHTAQRKQQRRI